MRTLQTNLFKTIEELKKQPLVIAYGLGVDSTAVLVELQKRNIRPDAILFADTGSEKLETYAYLPIINRWLREVGFPPVTIVRYKPNPIEGKLPYTTLGQNCLYNGTLPSLAFGFKSCSLKWKVVPQNQWTDQWLPARDCWAAGGKVLKIIGYDASPKDLKRYAHARDVEDPKYQYWYPLVDWNMDREACKAAIIRAGLPVPPKSACTFCPATQPEELHAFKKDYLRNIVLMEALATPKLEGCMNESQLKADYLKRHDAWTAKLSNAKGKKRAKLLAKEPKLKKQGAGCTGLWRKSTKKRPGKMTDYILEQGLLKTNEVHSIQAAAHHQNITKEPCNAESTAALWHDFLEMFTEEDGMEEVIKSRSDGVS